MVDSRFFKIKRPPQIAYKLGLGPLIGRVVLLLTTTGRKSGLARVTPLQYEDVDGDFYIGSARGDQADWFQNILADPSVEVQIKERRFETLAEPVTDIERIADFLELRIQRRPRMIPGIMRFEGLPKNHTRADLEGFAAGKALVILRPLETEGSHESRSLRNRW